MQTYRSESLEILKLLKIGSFVTLFLKFSPGRRPTLQLNLYFNKGQTPDRFVVTSARDFWREELHCVADKASDPSVYGTPKLKGQTDAPQSSVIPAHFLNEGKSPVKEKKLSDHGSTNQHSMCDLYHLTKKINCIWHVP